MCRCSDAEQCKHTAIKLNSGILKVIPPFTLKINGCYISYPYWRFNKRLHDYQSIFRQFEKQFAFLYPGIAYNMDPITLVDFIDDVHSEKPETFKCFAFKYLKKRPGGRLQA